MPETFYSVKFKKQVKVTEKPKLKHVVTSKRRKIGILCVNSKKYGKLCKIVSNTKAR